MTKPQKKLNSCHRYSKTSDWVMAKCGILKYPLSCSMESIKGCFVADSAFPRETTSIKMISILIPFMLIKQIEAKCLVDNANSRNGEQSSRPCHYPLIKTERK